LAKEDEISKNSYFWNLARKKRESAMYNIFFYSLQAQKEKRRRKK
jgi:hypothetical protein